MENAGVLNKDLEVTDSAFDRFVDDVGKCLKGEPLSFPFDCGPKLPPNPNADAFDALKDPTIFPEFHAFWRPRMTEVAKSYNIQGDMPFFPVCDPTAFALLFDQELPALTIPEILALIAKGPGMLPDLISLFPDLALEIAAPSPDFLSKVKGVPPPIPKVPVPALPPFPLDTKFTFELAMFQVPLKAFGLLSAKIPQLFTNPTIPGIIDLACEAVVEASPGSEEANDTRNCANKVLALFHTVFLQLALVAAMVGNGGLVRAQGAEQGFVSDPAPPSDENKEPGS